MSKNDQDEIFIVVGADREVGQNVVKYLVNRGKRVRILVEDNRNLKGTFPTEILDEIETIEEINEGGLKNCFNTKSDKEFIAYVISCVNNYSIKNLKCEKEEFCINSKLIQEANTHKKIKKFVLLSSAKVTKPFSFTGLRYYLRLSSLQSKAIIEDNLRKSGINYLIVRPSQLIINNETNAFTLSQGDKACNCTKIRTGTVGRLIVDTMLDPWIPNNTSIECITTKDQINQEYEYQQGRYRIRKENESEITLRNHSLYLRLFKLSFISLLTLTLIFGVRFIKRKNVLVKIAKFFNKFLSRGGIKLK
jgi:hypothetical protein